jgi:riboflavin kinase/FMN adenylyltransferase
MPTEAPPTDALTDDSPPLPEERNGSVVVIGNFDGVHRGHQAVLGEALAFARVRGLVLLVLTFDPHPSAVLGRGTPAVLTPLLRKAVLLRRAGADRVAVRRFDLPFSRWTPERFARELLAGTLHARHVVVGENFRFGAGRSGDLETLASLGRELGFDATVASIASDARGPFSSTRARDAIHAGDLAEAEAVLGRFHAFTGTVVAGAQRGRTIGFPTANLDDVVELVPPNGVYAVVVDRIVDGVARALGPGVMNIGVRPTVDEAARRSLEVHLFDRAEDLYGQSLRIHLVRWLRPERKFDSLDALKAQIASDAQAARGATAGILPSELGAYG